MGSPLDDSEEFEALFEQTYDAAVNATVRYVENYAYLLVQTWTEVGSVDLTIYKIDLNSGKTEIIYEELGGTYSGGFWVTEKEAIYLLKLFTLCKFEDGVLESIATFEHTEDVAVLMDGIAVSTYLQDNQRCIEIMDFNGNTLYDGKMFTTDIPEMDGDPNQFKKYGLLIVGGDSDKLIIGLTNHNNVNSESYVILLNLHNNLEPTLLWEAQ